MDQSIPPPTPRLPWFARLPLVLAGCLLIGLLATAACLKPSSKGFGTHQQLGLEACTLVQLFGMRCPSCGMTTSWAHMMRGQVLGALKANTGGALLAVLSMIAGPWMILSGLRGRWFLRAPNEILIAALGVTVVAVTLIDWCLRNFVFV